VEKILIIKTELELSELLRVTQCELLCYDL